MFKALRCVPIVIALSACNVSSPGFSPIGSSQTPSIIAIKRPPPLCIKLTDGDPGIRAGTVCAGRPYHHAVNASVCFPTSASPCVNVPKKATVQLTERNYKGTIYAALSSKKLPKAVLSNPAYPGALCDDVGTASYAEDELEIQPTRGRGPKRSFTLTDFGPRTGSSVSSDCQMIFYDQSNNVVQFDIVMLTVPG